MLERFWSHVTECDDGCWLWSGKSEWYGRFQTGRGQISAHRLSWILANHREIPPGMVVMHSCDRKRCVNPAHLSIGTVSQNTKDAVDKGLIDMSVPRSAIKKRDFCIRGHSLAPEDRYKNGKCRRCHLLREKRYKDRKNASRRKRRAELRAKGLPVT